MNQKIKENIVHKDILGVEVSVGDVVAAAKSNSLYICKITKSTNKMIRIKELTKNYDWLIYSRDVVKLTGSEATMYVLKNA